MAQKRLTWTPSSNHGRVSDDERCAILLERSGHIVEHVSELQHKSSPLLFLGQTLVLAQDTHGFSWGRGGHGRFFVTKR